MIKNQPSELPPWHLKKGTALFALCFHLSANIGCMKEPDAHYTIDLTYQRWWKAAASPNMAVVRQAKETTMAMAKTHDNIHCNFFLTSVDMLHLRAELNGAIITIESSQSTTEAAAIIAASPTKHCHAFQSVILWALDEVWKPSSMTYSDDRSYYAAALLSGREISWSSVSLVVGG